jgi:hypothetical protein
VLPDHEKKRPSHFSSEPSLLKALRADACLKTRKRAFDSNVRCSDRSLVHTRLIPPFLVKLFSQKSEDKVVILEIFAPWRIFDSVEDTHCDSVSLSSLNSGVVKSHNCAPSCIAWSSALSGVDGDGHDRLLARILFRKVSISCRLYALITSTRWTVAPGPLRSNVRLSIAASSLWQWSAYGSNLPRAGPSSKLQIARFKLLTARCSTFLEARVLHATDGKGRRIVTKSAQTEA